jgi:hypothetical protein
MRIMAMRMPLLAIALLLGGGATALADDMSQSEVPAPPNGPVKIIDAAPAASAGTTDQSQPAMPAPPAVSSQAKSQKEPERPINDSGSRYSFVRVDDGFLRFDLKTGQVAYCNSHADGWSCQAVPENRSALEREVNSLKDEVAALKRQIEDLREPPPPRPPAQIPPTQTAPPAQGDITRDTPGHDDIARAKAMLQDVWERLVAAIVGFKNDMLRKS